MVAFTLFTGMILLGLVILVVMRGMRYLERHPEVLTSTTPVAYHMCHETFAAITARYHAIKNDPLGQIIMAWHSPNGYYYMLTDEGIEERRSADDYRGAYRLLWPQIGGIGLRMQAGFRMADPRGGRRASMQYTTGYVFKLLVVPVSGRTMDITVPVDNRDDAVEFVAHTVALAEQKDKRVNAVGFDRPPAPHRQRMPRY